MPVHLALIQEISKNKQSLAIHYSQPIYYKSPWFWTHSLLINPWETCVIYWGWLHHSIYCSLQTYTYKTISWLSFTFQWEVSFTFSYVDKLRFTHKWIHFRAAIWSLKVNVILCDNLHVIFCLKNQWCNHFLVLGSNTHCWVPVQIINQLSLSARSF